MSLTQVAMNFQRYMIHSSHMATENLIQKGLNNTIIGNNTVVDFQGDQHYKMLVSNISSSFLMPPRPALTFDAHSIHRSSENGKLFTHSLHTGFPQFGHSLVDVSVLHNVQILFFIIIITPSKAKSISHICRIGNLV